MSNSTSYEIRVDDGVSGPVKTAAQALNDLRSGLDRSSAELRAMNGAMREMKKGGQVGSEGFKQLQKRIEEQTAKVGSMRAKYVELGGSFRKVKPPTRELSQLSKVAQNMPGPIGKAASALQGLSGWVVGGAVVGGIMAIVAGLGALAAASVAAGVSLLGYGIAQADARREELLRLEGLTRLRTMYGRVGGSATAMQAAIDSVSDSSSASRATLEGYAMRIHRLGLRGDAATAALEGAAMRGEVLGQRYGEAFIGMAASAARTGQSVRRLADDVKSRLGDVAARRMLSLGVSTRKLRENFSALFRNVKIEGFLKLFSEIVKGFSQARVTGRALAGIMERLFAPLNGGAERASGTIRGLFERMVLGLLRAEGAVLSLEVKFLQAWRRMNQAGITLEGTTSKLRTAYMVLGAVISAPFMVAAGAGYYFVTAIKAVSNAGSEAGERFRKAWTNFSFRDTARRLIDGLVIGIATGTVRVVNAVTTLAGATTDALRGALEIRSPSRVFADLGRQIPAGLAVGVDAGSGAANAAISNMIDVATGDVSASGGGQTVNRNASSITIENITIQTAATDADGIADGLRPALAKILEGLLSMEGEPA